MVLKLDISNIELHQNAAKQLITFAENEKIFVFEAPMGSGKTTFIKSLCSYLDATDTANSPTYSIVNEYNQKENGKIFHFDLYRLNSSEELFELGFTDYILSKSYLFIEWPELALPFLESYIKIIITSEDNYRYLYAEKLK